MCHDGPEVRCIDPGLAAASRTIVFHAPPIRVRRGADQADRGRDPRQGHGPAHRRRARSAARVYKEHSRVPAPGHRGDDRRPGPLSPHRPAQGTGVSTVRRAEGGAALSQGDPPRAGRFARARARDLRHRAQAGHPGPGPGDRQGDRPAGAGLRQRLHLPRQSSCPRVSRLTRGAIMPYVHHQGRRPLRGRRPAGPRHHRLPFRPEARTGSASAPRRSQGTTQVDGISTRCRSTCRATIPRPGRGRPRPQGRVGDRGSPGRPRPIADDPRSSIPRASRSADDQAKGSTDLFSATRIRAGIAHDRDPRPRPVGAPARDDHPRRPEAGRLGLSQGGRDRPADRPAPALGDDHRPDRRRRRPARDGVPGIEHAALRRRPAERGVLPTSDGPTIRTGRDGRFRVEGLVPGLKYGANALERLQCRSSASSSAT